MLGILGVPGADAIAKSAMWRSRRTVARAAILIVAAMMALPPKAAAIGSIASIRSSAGSDYTRIVIEVGQSTRYNYGTVQADSKRGLPPRLFLDLHEVRIGKSRAHDLWVGDTRVKRVRTGQYTDDKTRIVLDLEGPVTPTVIALTNPPRIVVELRGKGSAAKALAKAAPSSEKPSAETPSSGPSGPRATPPAKQVAKAPSKPTNPPKKAVAATGTPRRSETGSVRLASPGRQRVVIDAGHGGRDPGAKGYQGTSEKETVYQISERLAQKLRSRLGVEVVMTRSADKYIPLETRKDLANRVNADVFVSIHANASENRKLRGIETYYLKNSNDRATLRLAKLENGVDMLIKGRDISADADLPYILSDMVQGQKEADSILLANHMQDELVGHLEPRYHSVRSLGVKQGPFMVLDGTYMPSVLVEVGFISNSLEGRRLSSQPYRDAVAEGLYQGIKRYLSDARVAQLR